MHALSSVHPPHILICLTQLHQYHTHHCPTLNEHLVGHLPLFPANLVANLFSFRKVYINLSPRFSTCMVTAVLNSIFKWGNHFCMSWSMLPTPSALLLYTVTVPSTLHVYIGHRARMCVGQFFHTGPDTVFCWVSISRWFKVLELWPCLLAATMKPASKLQSV